MHCNHHCRILSWGCRSAFALALSLAAALGVWRPVQAEPPETAAEVSGARRLALEDLGPPPAEIARWIPRAGVRFRVGGPPPESESADRYREDWSDAVDAVTRYTIGYDYESRCRWRLWGRGDGRRLVIAVRFLEIRWEPQHVVWFRRQPAVESFWSDPLVLHELDHVRLSSDLRLKNRFAELLRETKSIGVPLSAGVRVDDRYVRRQVDEHVRGVFERIVELIEIRYRELDRLTGHGRRPLPPDAELAATLAESVEGG